MPRPSHKQPPPPKRARLAVESPRDTGPGGPLVEFGLRILATGLLASLLACGVREAETQPHWLDVAHRFTSPEPSAKPVPLELEGGGSLEDTPCQFRRRFGVRIPNGATVDVELPADTASAPVNLRLAGCFWNANAPGSSNTGEITVEFERAAESTADLPRNVTRFAPEKGWWQQKIPLEGAQPGDTIVISWNGPDAGLLLADEVVVERRRTSPEPLGEAGRLLILVSADTLRPDAIAALGCADCDTPNLDRLVAASQRFAPHYAAASWTKPSHASLLTGLLPEAHGSQAVEQPLGGLPTLAERMKEAGFHTTGVVDDVVWLDPKWGFDRGFDSYRVEPWTAGQSFRWALNEIADRPADDHFVFVHTFEPHSDIDILPYEGIDALPEVIRQRFGVEGYGCRERKCSALMLVAMRDGEIAPIEREPEILRFLYHAGVREYDRAVGQLIDGLQELGRWDDATIVFTSDHGEALLEHGRVEHGTNWDVVLRVPLLVKWPQERDAGSVFEQPTSAIDIAPTLLLAAGGNLDQIPEWYGLPLQTQPTEPASARRPIFSGTFTRSVWFEGWKLTERPNQPARLYDLSSDPDELTDLAGEHPERVERLSELIERRRLLDYGQRQHGDGVTLSPEEEERLRALGYLN